jgi:hypothetical protein
MIAQKIDMPDQAKEKYHSVDSLIGNNFAPAPHPPFAIPSSSDKLPA